MLNIKRILWVDDNNSNDTQFIFPSQERFLDENEKSEKITEWLNVGSMEDAIREFSSARLYHYDTIILDINFEDNSGDMDFIIQELSEKLYFTEEEKNEEFIQQNGGYLLYLYLLKRGYPSEQVAFLTGNPTIIKNIYPEEKDDSEEDEKLLLDDEDNTEKENTIQNNGDKMILRFYQANLKPPECFSKNKYFPVNHNIDDAENWIKNRSTPQNRARWLLLCASDAVETMFRESKESFISQIQSILYKRDRTDDYGIQSAFRQIYFIFNTPQLRHEEAYYQSVSAMLTPFDANINNKIYDGKRKIFPYCAKSARNFCAHNYFGTAIENKTAVFLIIIVLSALLNEEQRKLMNDWYQTAGLFLSDSDKSFSEEEKEKIFQDCLKFTENLLYSDNINEKILFNGNKNKKTKKDFQCEKYHDMVRVLGCHRQKPASEDAEQYFRFALAVGIVCGFHSMTDAEIKTEFGSEICYARKLALQIADTYLKEVKEK